MSPLPTRFDFDDPIDESDFNSNKESMIAWIVLPSSGYWGLLLFMYEEDLMSYVIGSLGRIKYLKFGFIFLEKYSACDMFIFVSSQVRIRSIVVWDVPWLKNHQRAQVLYSPGRIANGFIHFVVFFIMRELLMVLCIFYYSHGKKVFKFFSKNYSNHNLNFERSL